MTKLEFLISEINRVPYPDDVMLLKARIPELKDVSDYLVTNIFRTWSEHYWAAGWVGVSDENVELFRKFLLSDADDWEEPE